MHISWTCTCGCSLRVSADLAGRRVKCRKCQKAQVVPAPDSVPAPARAPEIVSGASAWAASKPSLAQIAAKSLAKDRAAHAPPPKTARDYVYLSLLAALIPLVLITFRKPDVGVRLEQTLEQAPEALADYVERVKERFHIGGPVPDGMPAYFPDEFYDALPNHRIDGALLARQSRAHYGLAALAVVGFFLLLMTLFPRDSTNLAHLPVVALFTGTICIVLLVAIQALAEATRGVYATGILALPLMILKIIGSSYGAAEDPNANLFISAFGFTLSVGMLEEFVKAIPLIWLFRRRSDIGWRAACLWGLASGVGFGVVEGAMYSANFYNGISGADIYWVRFLSCVALHAVWTASVGIICYKLQKEIRAASNPLAFFNVAFGVVVVSMLLHGLYDTFLKKGYDVLALVSALLSFAFLAWQIERQRGREPAPRLGRA